MLYEGMKESLQVSIVLRILRTVSSQVSITLQMRENIYQGEESEESWMSV